MTLPLVVCILAAAFCAAIAITVVALLLRVDRAPAFDIDDPMAAAYGDQPALPSVPPLPPLPWGSMR